MVFYHDEIGKPRLQVGRCVKRYGYSARGEIAADQIGENVADVKGPDTIRQREPPYNRSNLHSSTLIVQDDSAGKRLKKSVLDEKNNPILSGNENMKGEVYLESVRLAEKPKSVRRIDWLPTPREKPESKRCFEWTHRPTGYENPVQFEEPPEPGKRPTHPISPCGVPETGGRRCPEYSKVYPKTGIPAPALSKAPQDAGWGGWGPSGEPGRRRLDRPWEIADRNYDGPGESVEMVIGDMSKKKFSDQRYQNTSALTMWHFDSKHDIDPIYQRRIHHCEAVRPDGTGRLPHMPAAGKKSGAVAEGSALPWYDTVRGREAFFAGDMPDAE
jgi:hypothetical protein